MERERTTTSDDTNGDTNGDTNVEGGKTSTSGTATAIAERAASAAAEVAAAATNATAAATEATVAAASQAKEALGTAATNVVEAQEQVEQAAARQTVPKRVAHRRGGRALLVATAGLAGFAGIFVLVRAGATAAVDLRISRAIQSLRSPVMARAMTAISWPGFPPQSRVIPPVMIAAQAGLGFRLEAAFQALAWTTGLVSSGLKTVMKRPRPLPTQIQVVVHEVGGSSFPSGHVLVYVGTYGFLSYLVFTLVRPETPRLVATGSLVGLIALVGPSRIYQGHHWPTDVLASYLLGLGYLIGLTAVYRQLKLRSARPGPLA